jgi:CubicO group peptidase (beta-lactamase class C family)
MKTRIGILLVCVAMMSSSCKKDNVDITSQTDVKEAISDMDLTSASWAVVKNGELLWSDATGEASAASGELATVDTRYLVASVSKTITATALMKLYDQGLFQLDDDINASLPFSVRNPDFPSDAITFRMLLSHNSSISDAHQNTLDLYCYNSDCAASLEDFFQDVFVSGGAYNSPDNFSTAAPGTAEEYTNLGHALIGYLVERISGQPFDEYCEVNIFQPLGMTKTEWRLANTPLAELAEPNSTDLQTGNIHYTFPDYPNGGLRTTPNDLSRFLRMFMLSGNFDGTTILQPSTVDLMKTLQFGSIEMCLTFYYETIGGRTMLGHSGGEMGVTTEMYFDPETNVGVIIFNNDDDANLDEAVGLLLQYGEAN